MGKKGAEEPGGVGAASAGGGAWEPPQLASKVRMLKELGEGREKVRNSEPEDGRKGGVGAASAGGESPRSDYYLLENGSSSNLPGMVYLAVCSSSE